MLAEVAPPTVGYAPGAMVTDLSALRAHKRNTTFFECDARVLARRLLGDHLVHVREDAICVGRIVETEAYRGPNDLACHARVGLTKRTRTLLGPAGFAYVYLIYGMYDCFNVVGGGDDQRGHAVLVRAVEPTFGIEGKTDGPGKLTRAMAITRAHDGTSLASDTLFVAAGTPPRRVGRSARVGVGYAGRDAARPWRFFDRDSAHVSRPSPSQLVAPRARTVKA